MSPMNLTSDCPELTRPTYGSLSTTEVKEGTTVKVKCNKGYTMFGDSILECLPGATWNTTVPDCVRGSDILMYLMGKATLTS